MKISEVRTIVTSPRQNYVLVKILTDEGIYGCGDASLNGREWAVAEALEKHIGPLLIGRDPRRIEDTWQEIFRGTFWRGGPVLQSALAGVDLALWDIKGKIANLPCYELLGGRCREKARVYLHTQGRDFAEALNSCRGAMEKGCTALRTSVGIPEFEKYAQPEIGGQIQNWSLWEPEPYLRTMPRLFGYLRENLGEEVDFLHDVHERINPIQACRLAKELEPIHLFFLEDPIRPENKESFRLIRQHTTTPLAMGELYFSVWEYLPLVTEQLIDFVRLDVMHFGGITAAKKMAAIAEHYYVNMAFHGPGDISPIGQAANVHLDLAIPNFGIQEWVFYPPEVREVVKGGPVYEDGYVNVPEEPGLGVDIEEEAARKYPYQRRYLPTLRRADGSVADW